MTNTNIESNMEAVKAQLMYEWDEQENDEGEVVDVRGAQVMSESEAIAMILRHKDVFEKGLMLRSFPYYIANQIRQADSKE